MMPIELRDGMAVLETGDKISMEGVVFRVGRKGLNVNRPGKTLRGFYLIDEDGGIGDVGHEYFCGHEYLAKNAFRIGEAPKEIVKEIDRCKECSQFGGDHRIWCEIKYQPREGITSRSGLTESDKAGERTKFYPDR